MTASAPPPPVRDSDEDVADTPQIRALRIAVTVMGLILVIGFLTVIARIVYLASRPAAQAGAPVAASAPAASLAPEALLELPEHAATKAVSLSGDRLAVQYVSPLGEGIAIVDLLTGRVVSNVRIVPKAGSR